MKPTLFALLVAVVCAILMPTVAHGLTDLDVTYISRSPRYWRYDIQYTGQGIPYESTLTKSKQKWPAEGEQVTFTAHVTNKGNAASGSFGYRWTINGSVIGTGTIGSLAPGAEGTASLQWTWAMPTPQDARARSISSSWPDG